MKSTYALLLMVLVATTGVPLTVAQEEDGPECTQVCENAVGIELDPDEAAQLAVRLERLARYTALRLVFPEEMLDAFDESQKSYDRMVDIDTSLFHAPSESEGDTFGDIMVAEEIAKEATRADILKKVVQIAEGAAPSLNTWVHMREQSNDEDFWTFYASVRAYDASASLVGNTYAMHVMEDDRFWTDGWQGVLELALAEVSPDLSEITDVQVEVRVMNCHYGWFSGKFKGCDSGFDTDNIVVEFLDLV